MTQLWEELGEVIIGLIVALILLGAFALAVKIHQSTVAFDSNVNDTMTAFRLLQRDSQAASSKFIPTVDLAGKPNCDANGNCHELDYLREDQEPNSSAPASYTNIVGKYYAWCFSAVAGDCSPNQPVGTLAIYNYPYSYSRTPSNAAGLRIVQNAVSTISGFSAKLYDGSAAIATLPAAQNYPGSLACTQTKYDWGMTSNPGGSEVTSATCRIYQVSIAAGQFSTAASLTDTIVPVQVPIVIGNATPQPYPISAAGISFRAPVANPQTATVSEYNYGNKTGVTPPQVYTLSPAPGVTCAPGDATYAPKNSVTPVVNGSNNGIGTITFTPTISVNAAGATCSVIATDNENQQAAIPINIGPIYQPTSSGPITLSYSSGVTQNVTVSEQNYALGSPDRGGFAPVAGTQAGVTAKPASVCSAPTQVGTSIATPSYTETEKWQVSFLAPGTCTVTFTDVYGDSTQTVVQATIPTVWPQYVVYPLPGKAVGACAVNQPEVFAGPDFGTLYKNQVDPNDASFNTDANGCLNHTTAGANDNQLTDPSVLVNETNYSGAFHFSESGVADPCGNYINNGGASANPNSNQGPTAGWIISGAALTPSGQSCEYALVDNTFTVTPSNTVTVRVYGCNNTGGEVAIGQSCTFSIPPDSSSGDCEIKGVGGDQVNYYYFATFDPADFRTSDPGLAPPAYPSPNGTLQAGPSAGEETFTRTTAGTVNVYIWQLTTEIRGKDCAFTHGWVPEGSVTFN